MNEKTICNHCGCDNHSEHAQFCHNCGGMLLENYCSNPQCEINNIDHDPIPVPSDSCYCDKCGSETDYFKNGYIKQKKYRED